MHVYFVTGASKGIGLAISKELLQENNIIVCVARTKNEELLKCTEEKKGKLIFLEYDLAESSGLHALMKEMLSFMPENPQSVTLINNAGVIDPIGRAENNDHKAIIKSIAVNLTAPMVLTSTFIKQLESQNVPKKVINISSGAGRHPYSGWSSYCAGKAGLDHYTRVVSEEQKHVPNGVKVISVAPGIIDTGMQERIRESDREDFELLDRFVEYKEQGKLSLPEQTAKKLIQIIQSETFDDLEAVIDIRDFHI
ncbi:(S)-benzoin forming benzil reductase [Lederbergia wuyishanensis]|uniref:Sepiapterin reductase n=1 Tax=Lederbergia wuyishanensis TaxID=1347903 RepID=A0ABU0CZ43_9BACI|nr:(S)-benzoin forming benzil reductase [Lederbergia wuyishanensis]MCJ8006037.1 (S)-benzoin forming benzil reductase [Lederbergia wuyishanensis]MDQ0341404.1 sepiapterin reductase [Lederbergia wuyishanensis]